MEYIKLSYHHLNFEDRTALMLESRKEGFSARKFAELIKRHPSTIYRELKRNSINDVYQARYASDNTFARRRRGHRKLKIDSILWKFIVEAIRCLWSPQQIAKRLKTFPDLDQTMNVSHTTIYSTIRALPKGELKKDLLSCLRHENKKRKANGEPKKDSILQDIKTIHERPAEVQERKIPGHWEADLIKGKDNKSSIATLIERNTRLCILATLPDAKAESVRKALTEALKYLPAELRKTLTYDRGREMSEHKILEEDLGIDVYFCDPHSPWQKGTCENMNGLIRQYLPKGIDLNQADQHYLNQVAMSLNTRPRKALDWLTPLEKFAQLDMLYYSFKYPKMGYFGFWRWCLDMNINHQLKFSFLDFLSNQTFFNSEFKNIRAEFIKYSPEYEPKRFYSKIYIIFRELVSQNLIFMDTSNCTYKYSSNYSKKDICDLISQLKSLEVENCLSMEYTRVNENISDLFQELSIYKKYLIKFPKCSELINRFIDQKESEIHLLSYELKALRNLLEAE